MIFDHINKSISTEKMINKRLKHSKIHIIRPMGPQILFDLSESERLWKHFQFFRCFADDRSIFWFIITRHDVIFKEILQCVCFRSLLSSICADRLRYDVETSKSKKGRRDDGVLVKCIEKNHLYLFLIYLKNPYPLHLHFPHSCLGFMVPIATPHSWQ